jgi:hypothetical protein
MEGKKRGRPRGPGAKGAALSLRIPTHLRAQIDEKVEADGTNLAHAVETLLMEGLMFERLAGTALRFDHAALERLMHVGNYRMSRVRTIRPEDLTDLVYVSSRDFGEKDEEPTSSANDGAKQP